MTNKEIVLKAIELLTKYKKANISGHIVKESPSGEITVSITFKNRGSKFYYFSKAWFDVNFRWTVNKWNFEDCKIPAHLPDDERLALRIAHWLWREYLKQTTL